MVTAPYTSHESKIAQLQNERTEPFNDAWRTRQSPLDAETALSLIGGTMRLPPDFEARLLLSIAAGIQHADPSGNSGVKIGDEAWSLLDLVLAAHDVDPTSAPLAAVGEMMMIANVTRVRIRGVVHTAVDVFELSFHDWSDVTKHQKPMIAANHFRMALALRSIDGRSGAVRALDHLAAAAALDPARMIEPAVKVAAAVVKQHGERSVIDGYTLVSPRTHLRYRLHADGSKVDVNDRPFGTVLPTLTIRPSLEERRRRETLVRFGMITAAAAVVVGSVMWLRRRKS